MKKTITFFIFLILSLQCFGGGSITIPASDLHPHDAVNLYRGEFNPNSKSQTIEKYNITRAAADEIKYIDLWTLVIETNVIGNRTKYYFPCSNANVDNLAECREYKFELKRAVQEGKALKLSFISGVISSIQIINE